MPSPRRRLTILATTAVAATTLWTGVAGAEPATPANQLLQEMNARRAAVGVAPLTIAPQATTVAQQWATSMAAAGQISHRRDLTAGMPSTWLTLGENVGTGPDAADIHRAFVASPTHDANIVDPRFASVGIGVVEVDGRLFVAEEFLTTAPPRPARTARRTRVVAHRTTRRRHR